MEGLPVAVFCEKIGFRDEALRFILDYPLAEKDWRAYRALFFRDQERFIAAVQETEDSPGLFLILYARLSAEAFGEYRERNIPEGIFFGTFMDLFFWHENYFSQTGKHGIAVSRWMPRHILLRIFRLGRLQFEPQALSLDLEAEGMVFRTGDLVLNVHIPQGAPLVPEECEKSYREALLFFRGINPVFICNSWLLFPGLPELLPPESNILSFQKPYRIYDVALDSRQGEERIFGTVLDDPRDYPEGTNLQRSAKAYLTAGNRIGQGKGFFYYGFHSGETRQ
ncbi:acyltransferase domain-containing protein [Breznakiella homolactica]|uniref:DUF5596 domain-containing protein n=1 Tax=Breznakiella homolactica TaxID=2798577 RepID=A0A7T7XMT2_9SPIR|nr:acyltransferase domain-containing protein [Breznakiella homolactica]QQO09118.1 acyltransferase domain-containing protein [Breznakiella homolactica]